MIKRIGFLSLLLGFGLAASAQSGIATSVNQLPLTGKNTQYVNNRAPLRQNALLKLPVGSIVPEGWLGKYLALQKDGLTGHLGEISACCPKKIMHG